MSTKTRILLGAIFFTVILIGVRYFLDQQNNQYVSQVSISTDKQEYSVGNTIHIRIQNMGDRPIYIYCLEQPCALSNFPTTVERFANGQWEDFGGLCVRSEQLFEQDMVSDGNYIRHTLSARNSFELVVSALFLEQDERVRVIYYVGPGRKSIYSNEFIVKH